MDDVHTTDKPTQRLFPTTSRPPPLYRLGMVVLSVPEFDLTGVTITLKLRHMRLSSV